MNAPTLLIGLGGTGCKIIEKVSQMCTQDQLNNIAFAVFDTDINDLDEIEKRNPFIKTIQTSTKQTVGEYLNQDRHARDTWFPVNAILNGKTLTEGAGQVRAISRLALETVIRAGKMTPLHEAIQSLYKVEEDKIEQALRVVIVSSLAGGTGSGLILPVAMYVRNYLATHFRQSANITRGFFILPEVFGEVIRGETEMNNLKANSYATLRELDAFLMKGDATLDEKYMDSVRIQFPMAASSGYEEYDVRPYDFCFLFDAQNADGGKLNSFEQYLEHAANCIYAQSIGPMNKRSNSSEDNTIRKLAKERGRNRYAGAGASMLIYPFEDIRNFIALKWAKQSISSQWLMFDDMYKEICKENAEKAEEGMIVQNPDAADFYVNQIDSMAKMDKPFAKAIVKFCANYGADGVTVVSNKYKNYVGAVVRKVEDDIVSSNVDIESDGERLLGNIADLAKDKSEYVSIYYECLAYKKKIDAYVEEKAPMIAYSMFKPPRNNEIGDREYNLEKQLITQEGSFMHPNAVRYFLIKAKDLMSKQKRRVDADFEEVQEFYNNFDEIFDDPETEERETAADFASEESGGIKDKLKRKNTDLDRVKQGLKDFCEKANEYMELYTKQVVLERGMKYLGSIIDSFESFYKTFDSKVATIDNSINDIYKKYVRREGTTARYVCASRTCLDKLYDSKPYTGSFVNIDSDLAQKIYFSVLAYAVMKNKPGHNRHFSELFDEGILGYYEDSVMKAYGNDIDIDIIEALEKEAVYENNYNELENGDFLIEQYVRKTINDIRTLACPFIESPLGEAREPIDACAINKYMAPDKGDDSPRAQLIRKELLNYGGVADEDIYKNTIFFYKSFYGLRANDLSKFAPPEKSMTYKRVGGEYFKAYFELIKGINPETHKSMEISPHIDRWWHIPSKMPDLDEDHQIEQENRIYSAFFWGILGGYIDIFEEDGRKLYLLKADELKMDENTLVVSNGTECDKLYEVLDAVAIYPRLVSSILEKIDTIVEYEVNEDKPLDKTKLMTCIDEFYLEEPGIGPDKKIAKSIFDIPMLMKKSSIQNEYYEDDVVKILDVEIEEIQKYISRFVSQKEVTDLLADIMEKQYALYLEDIAEEQKTNTGIYRESLFTRTCARIANAFEQIGRINKSEEIRKTANSLRKQIDKANA